MGHPLGLRGLFFKSAPHNRRSTTARPVPFFSPGVIPSPGYHTSGTTEEHIQQYVDSVVPKIPLGRTGTLDEVAKLVSFLASDESSYITGIVDGGMTQI